MAVNRMTEKEKVYFICLLIPLFWIFLPALIACDIGEAIGRGFASLYRRLRR